MKIFYNKVTTLALNFCLGSLLFSASACAQEDYTPKKYMGLKGKVACIRDTTYDYTLTGFNAGSGKLMEVKAIDFDAEGNAIKIIKHNADSSYVAIYSSVYKDNILFSGKGQTHIGEDILSYSMELIGTDNDTLLYKESNDSRQEGLRKIKTTGKYHLESSTSETGTTTDETWADDHHNIIRTRFLVISNEVEFSNGTHTLEQINTMKYDKDGNMIENVHIEGNDTTTTTVSHHLYDKHGNWTEERSETNGYYKQLVKRTIKYAE